MIGAKRIILAFLLLGAMVAPARAEDPQAAVTRLVAQVTAWLTNPVTTPTPWSIDGASVVSLDRASNRDLATAASRLAGGRLLASAVYPGRPATLATDLSGQLQVVEDVPADLIKPLLVAPSNAQRCNEIAGNWAATLLDARDDDPIAAFVYAHADEDNHSLLDGAEAKVQIMMVLIRVTRDPRAGDLRIGRVAIGSVVSIR